MESAEECVKHVPVKLNCFQSWIKVPINVMVTQLSESPECVFRRHDHEQDCSERCLSLTVTDFRFEDGTGFQDSIQVLLT